MAQPGTSTSRKRPEPLRIRPATTASEHSCLPPCCKQFPSAAHLEHHIARSAGCYQRWGRHQQQILNSILGVTRNTEDESPFDVPIDETPGSEEGGRMENESGMLFEDAGDMGGDEPDPYNDPLPLRPPSPPPPLPSPPPPPPLPRTEHPAPEPSLEGTAFVIDPYYGAAVVIGKEPSTFEQIEEKRAGFENKTLYSPFASRKEFDLVCWLNDSGTTQSDLTDFLHLDWVSCVLSQPLTIHN